jgi:hypothetical protein
MMDHFKRTLRRPMKSEKIEIFTDGNDDYTYALPCFFKVRELNYGQLVKIRDANGRLIRKEIRVVYGNSDIEDVETVNVENFNSILRGKGGQSGQEDEVFLQKEDSSCVCD